MAAGFVALSRLERNTVHDHRMPRRVRGVFWTSQRISALR
jgi:hypothetical protein